jgi:phospholipase C
MTRRQARSIGILTVLVLTALLLPSAGQPTGEAAAAGRTQFQHIIVIVQENRTPDNLFHGLCVPPFGAANRCSDMSIVPPSPIAVKKYNIQTANWLDKAAPGGTITPTSVPLGNKYDLDHSHRGFTRQCDADPGTTQCKMDATPARGFRFVGNATGVITPYLELATQYGWANFMFQSNQGPSYPAHQFLFGGTSAPSAADDAAGIFAAENITKTGIGGLKAIAGCNAPKGATVELIGPSGEGKLIYPCFEHKTLADLLGTSLTWRYYTPSPGMIWTAPNAIEHICHGGPTAIAYTPCSGPEWDQHLDLHPADVLSDIGNCKLRSLSWVIPTAANSDHAAVNDGGGPSWVASIVNAIGASKSCDGGQGYWENTAIVVTWDDWGGWYDHVAPTFLAMPQGDYGHGFRVPLIVISAYTPKGYINNVQQDFGSILRFAEHNFGISEGALNFDDARSKGDLSAFFDFTQPPRAFQTIAAPKSAAFFLHDKRPQGDPDDE